MYGPESESVNIAFLLGRIWKRVCEYETTFMLQLARLDTSHGRSIEGFEVEIDSLFNPGNLAWTFGTISVENLSLDIFDKKIIDAVLKI